jgi:hypothetical protein
MTMQNQDELGITPVENAAIDALSAGVPQEDVNTLSRGQADVQLVSNVDYTPSQFDDEEHYTKYPDGTSEFADINNNYYKPYLKPAASRKAMLTSLAVNNPNGYESIYDQLSSTGYSSSLDVLQDEVNNKNREGILSDAEHMSIDGDVDGLETLYKLAPSILTDEALPNVTAFKNAAQSFTEASEGIDRNREHSRNFLSNIHSWAVTREKIIDNIIFPEIAESDSELGNYITDVTDMAIFGEQPLALAKIGSELLGERYNFLGGTMFRDLAQLVRNQPNPEAQMAMAERVVESVTRNAGVLKDNDFVKTYALDTFKLMLEAPGGDDKVTRWLTDIFGVVDVVSFIPTAFGVKWVKRLLNLKKNKSAVRAYNASRGELAEINPDLDAVLGSRSIQDEATAAKLGTDPQSELLRVLPKAQFDGESKVGGAPIC